MLSFLYLLVMWSTLICTNAHISLNVQAEPMEGIYQGHTQWSITFSHNGNPLETELISVNPNWKTTSGPSPYCEALITPPGANKAPIHMIFEGKQGDKLMFAYWSSHLHLKTMGFTVEEFEKMVNTKDQVKLLAVTDDRRDPNHPLKGLIRKDADVSSMVSLNFNKYIGAHIQLDDMYDMRDFEVEEKQRNWNRGYDAGYQAAMNRMFRLAGRNRAYR